MLSIVQAIAVGAILIAAVAPNANCQNPEAKTETDERLIDLAEKKFEIDAPNSKVGPEQRATFERFFNNVQNGVKTDLKANDSGKDDPATANTWNESRVINASWIHWLCTEPAATRKVPNGIMLASARIEGDVNLQSVKIPFALVFYRCAFMDSFTAHGADVQDLSFQGSWIQTLQAADLTIEKSLNLSQNFWSEGTVWLRRLKVGGTVDCSNSTFHRGIKIDNPKALPHALDLNSANIGADFSITDSVLSGVLELGEAQVNGSIYCHGTTFNGRPQKEVPEDNAIFGRNLKITRDLSLTGVHTYGAVNLSGASIGGTLECSGCFQASTAINASSATINGSMRLAGDVTVRGWIDLSYATIGQTLELRPDKALEASFLSLQNAKAGILLNDQRSWSTTEVNLRGFTFSAFHSDVSPPKVDQVKWLRQTAVSFSPQPYDQVASVLRTTGLEDEMRQVMVAKNWDAGSETLRNDRNLLSKTISWCWYRPIGLLIGYGFYPWRALYLSAFIVAVGAVIFKIGYVKGAMVPTEKEAYRDQRQHLNPTYPKFNAFIYSLEMFVPIVKLKVGDYWLPNANAGAAGSFFRCYLWVHILLGWALTTLWVAAFTGFIKT